MTCDALQAVHESLGLEEARSTPVEIDHALILCRLVGLSRRSAQQLSSEASKLGSLPQPDHHREIWKTKHALIAFRRRGCSIAINGFVCPSMRAFNLGIVFRSTK